MSRMSLSFPRLASLRMFLRLPVATCSHSRSPELVRHVSSMVFHRKDRTRFARLLCGRSTASGNFRGGMANQ
eukprot:140648-Amphidinium_carterae.1